MSFTTSNRERRGGSAKQELGLEETKRGNKRTEGKGCDTLMVGMLLALLLIIKCISHLKAFA